MCMGVLHRSLLSQKKVCVSIRGSRDISVVYDRLAPVATTWGMTSSSAYTTPFGPGDDDMRPDSRNTVGEAEDECSHSCTIRMLISIIFSSTPKRSSPTTAGFILSPPGSIAVRVGERHAYRYRAEFH